MTCDRLREVLIEHVDGLLDAEDAEGARSHLAHCADCAELRDEVRLGFGALDAWEDEDLPEGAWDRMAARLPLSPPVMDAAADASVDAPVPPVVAAPAPATSVRSAGLPYILGLATAAAAMLAIQPLLTSPEPQPIVPDAVPVETYTAPVAVEKVSDRSPAPRVHTVATGATVNDFTPHLRNTILPWDPVAGHFGAPSTVSLESRDPGENFVEKPLRFPDFDSGVMIEFRLPPGVDPDKVTIERGRTPAVPARAVR
ncbi:MAG: anti-sigma factor family protein [Planctomycetota bacterium]|jgi:anti-sigma factor RsiW